MNQSKSSFRYRNLIPVFITGLLLEMSLCFVMCNNLFGLCGDEDKDADKVPHMNIVALSTVVVPGMIADGASCSANFRTAQVQC
jgi:hypothetical protein